VLSKKQKEELYKSKLNEIGKTTSKKGEQQVSGRKRAESSLNSSRGRGGRGEDRKKKDS